MDKMQALPPFGWIKCKYIYKTGSNVDNMQIQSSNNKNNNKFQERTLAKLQSTAKWETPGKVDLKSWAWVSALSFPQLGSLMPFLFSTTTCKEKKRGKGMNTNPYTPQGLLRAVGRQFQQNCLVFGSEPLLSHSGYVITPFRHCALNSSTWETCR